jgi:hypothetical protein
MNDQTITSSPMLLDSTPTDPSTIDQPADLPPHTAPSPPPPPHPRTTDPREGRGPRAFRLGLALAILAVAAAVDVPLAKATFDLALELPEVVSWTVAAGVAAIAVAGAWKSGASLNRGRLGEAIGASAVPITVAVGLFVLRWNAHVFASATAAWEGSDSESAIDVASEQVLAIVMLLFFLATSVLAFFDGLHLTDDAGARVRSTAGRLAEVEANQVVEEGRLARLEEETAKGVQILRQTAIDEEHALAALDARRDELKAWARTEIARLLGDPAATSAVILAQRAADARDAAAANAASDGVAGGASNQAVSGPHSPADTDAPTAGVSTSKED